MSFRFATLPSILVAVFLVGACGGGSDNPTQAVDPADPATVGLVRSRTLTLQGIQRTYDLFVPRSPANAPLVFLFHGFSDSSAGLLGLDGGQSPYEVWLDIAERENLILVVPNGLDTGTGKGWNDCRSDAVGNSTQDDVAFVRQLLDVVVQRYSADASRVYASGTSNGGHFSIRLGLEMADKLTAFAAIAAANSARSKCASSSTPVSALFMNGTADPLLPFAGGEMAGGRGLVSSAGETVADWVARNRAETSPDTFAFPDNPSTSDNSSVTRLAFRNGTRNTEVMLYRVDGGGHNEPSIHIAKQNTAGDQNRDLEMAEEVWQFFRGKVRQAQ